MLPINWHVQRECERTSSASCWVFFISASSSSEASAKSLTLSICRHRIIQHGSSASIATDCIASLQLRLSVDDIHVSASPCILHTSGV